MHPLTDEEVAFGPLIPELIQTAIIGKIANTVVRLVDSSVPLLSRRAIARVAYVAQRSMPTYKTGYDGTVTEEDQRLYVLAKETRTIGMVLSALQDSVWQAEWAEDGRINRVSNIPIKARLPVIARIWIATDQRGAGFGRQLIECALDNLGVLAPAVGWEFPFTESGGLLVKAICPNSFQICCDGLTLQRRTTLKPLS